MGIIGVFFMFLSRTFSRDRAISIWLSAETKASVFGLYTCSCEVSSKVNVRLCQILILTHQVFLWCEQITILVVSLVHFVVAVPVVHISY